MVLPKKLFSLLTAQSLVKSVKSEEISVIRDFPLCFLVAMYVRSRLCIRTYVRSRLCIRTYVRSRLCIRTYVEVTFMYSYVRGGHVLLVTLFLFVFFCSVLVSILHASLFLSLLAWGGGGCLHITVLVHFVNSAGLSRIYNNTSASGSASALRALRVVYTQL